MILNNHCLTAEIGYSESCSFILLLSQSINVIRNRSQSSMNCLISTADIFL